MADIKQAAKWLQEGEKIQRVQYAGYVWVLDGRLRPRMIDPTKSDGSFDLTETMTAGDLIADDWEIVDDEEY